MSDPKMNVTKEKASAPARTMQERDMQRITEKQKIVKIFC